MKIFVSYSSKDQSMAERIALALRNLDHDVFFDRDALPPGEEYDRRIRDEILGCDRFAFCLSEHSLSEGSYALTELSFARERWPHPKERVLSVVLDETPIEEVPPYLSAATLLRPVGDVAAEVAGTVSRLTEVDRRLRRTRWSATAAVTVVALVAIGVIAYFFTHPEKSPLERVSERLHSQLPDRAGLLSRTYPQFGFGFQYPRAWQVEDAASPYGVPDIDVIQRYTDQKAAIGVEFRLLPVQPNYIDDFAAEVRNQADVFRNVDPKLVVEDTTVAGKPGKRFRYVQGTGDRMGDITRTWVRLVPEVKLQIITFTYTDEADREAFLGEARRIMDSIVIDEQVLSDIRSTQRRLQREGPE